MPTRTRSSGAVRGEIETLVPQPQTAGPSGQHRLLQRPPRRSVERRSEAVPPAGVQRNTTSEDKPSARDMLKQKQSRMSTERRRLRVAEDERQTLACISWSLIGAVALIVSGSVLVQRADYENISLDELATYNAVVDDWTQHYVADFEATSWSLRIDEQEVPLTAVHQDQPILTQLKSNKSAVHPYTPLAYELPTLWDFTMPPGADAMFPMCLHFVPHRHGQVIPLRLRLRCADAECPRTYVEVPKAGTFNLGDARDNGTAPTRSADNATTALMLRRHNLTLAGRMPDGRESVLFVGELPLLEPSISHSAGWKNCVYQDGGYYAGGDCLVWMGMSFICLKVRLEDGVWVKDERFGGWGCDPGNNWQPVYRVRIRAPQDGRAPPAYGVKEFAPAKVSVRHGADPALAAANSTSGTMYLARGRAEANATGKLLLVFGCALLVPAVVLTYPFVMRCVRRRRRAAATQQRQSSDRLPLFFPLGEATTASAASDESTSSEELYSY